MQLVDQWIGRITSYLNSFISTLFNLEQIDASEYESVRRYFLYNLCLLFYILFTILSLVLIWDKVSSGFRAFIPGSIVFNSVIFALSLTTRKYKLGIYYVIFSFGIISLWFMISGSIQTVSYMVLFALPPLAYLLIGRKKGLWMIFGFGGLLTLVLFNPIIPIDNSFKEKIYLIFSFALMGLLTHQYESTYEFFLNRLIIRIRSLNTTLKYLERSERRLKESEKMRLLGQLASGIAHDYNNILLIVSNGVAYLRGEDIKNPELEELLDKFDKLTFRAADLTRNLLNYANQGHFKFKTVSLNELLDETADILRQTAPKGITIKVETSRKNWFIRADDNQLLNALINIGKNGIDAIQGKGVVTLKLERAKKAMLQEAELASSKNFVKATISDTGSGIDKKIVLRAVEPFFTTKPVGKGTGLGLSSARGVIESHQGKLTLKSKTGRGTQVSIFLPEVPEEVIASEKRSVKQNSRKNVHLMLIDDELILLQTMAKLFERERISVDTFSDGIQAIEFYKQNHKIIDLIILDLNMPLMDGYECFKRLKEINPDLTVVLLSGNPTQPLVKDTLAEGALSCLSKPIRFEDLLVEVLALIEKGKK